MSDDNLHTATLTDLLARARDGNDAALNDLLERCSDRLRDMARRMLRGYSDVARWEDTDDVLQNALVRLVQALRTVSPGNTRAFFGLAANQIRWELLNLAQRYRGPHGLGRNYRSAAPPAPGEPPPVPDPSDGAPDADELDLCTAFHGAVEGLPVGVREVFSLVFYSGWTQAQIAELFGVDERTVRRRWQVAVQSLREALGGKLPAAAE